MLRLFSQFRLRNVTRFSKQDKQELVKFQGFDWMMIFRPIFLGLIAAYFIAVASGIIFSFEPEGPGYEAAVTRAASAPNAKARLLLEKHRDYRSWIEKRGTSGELRAFNSFSTTLLKSASKAGPDSSFTLNLYFSILRIAFLIIVSSRLCVIALIGAIVLGKHSWRVHEGDDVLGETGNGRLFYTGIRARLENLSPEGIPDKQITGLACPPMKAESEVRSSKLGELLEGYGADCRTNIELAGIVLSLSDYPAFIADPGEERELAAVFQKTGLVEMTEALLETAFSARENFVSGSDQELIEMETEKKYELSEYCGVLGKALHQVLSHPLKQSLADLNPHSLATTILALQAGKVLAYEREAEHWFIKSIFPQLCARSVLHSVTAFSEEYSYKERADIRRALIYAARSSLFGPVRFSRDLTTVSRALRQWVELMMCPPHHLPRVAAEVELAHLTWELHQSWSEKFFENIESLEDLFPNQIHATDTNLLLLPLPGVVSIARKSIEEDLLQRLHLLTRKVSDMQNDRKNQAPSGELTEHIKTEIPEYERVLPPFKKKEIKSLAKEHGLEQADLKDWSAVRVVLMNFGWLARRIGDYTVPDCAVVHAVIHGAASEAEKNSLGLVGQHGVVAVRAVRLQEHYGKDWQSNFYEASSATMSESREQFERQLKGLPDDLDEEPIPEAVEGV